MAIITITLEDLVAGDFIGLYRRSADLVWKDQFALAAGNNLGGTSITVSTTIPADNPTSANSKIRIRSTAKRDEHRYRYASYAGAVFTLSAASTGTASATSDETTIIDTSATFITDGVEPGDVVRNTTDGVSYSKVYAVVSQTELTVTEAKTGQTWASQGYSVNTLAESYPAAEDAFVPIIEREAPGATDSEQLDYSTPIDFKLYVRRSGKANPIEPFEKNGQITATRIFSACRIDDEVLTASVKEDIAVDWEVWPRLIYSKTPQLTEITMQDLHDTISRLSENPAEGLSYPNVVESSGNWQLRGGIKVGITSKFIDAQLIFDAVKESIVTGTVTTQDTNGVILTDSAAKFITDGVLVGAWLVNLTDAGSVATVLEVISETQLRTDGLEDGADNQFDVGDSYKIWNIVLAEALGGNLIAENAEQISPVLNAFGTQVYLTSASYAAIQDQEALRTSIFGGVVYVDAINGVPGTDFPKGTQDTPSSNWTDASEIAAVYNIKIIRFLSDYTFSSADVLDGWQIEGSHSNHIDLVITSGVTTSNTSFANCKLDGTLSGTKVAIDDCIIGTLYAFSGAMKRCTLIDYLGIVGTDAVQLNQCWAGDFPVIDCGGNGPELVMGQFSGNVKIQNKTGSADASLNFVAGRVLIDSTVTNGEVAIRGDAFVTDNSTGTAVINREVQSQITPMAYNGEIYIDVARGGSGQIYPWGTHWQPVNNLVDAYALSQLYGTRIFKLAGTIILDRDYEGYTFSGIGQMITDIVVLTGYSVNGSTFEWLSLTGTGIGVVDANGVILQDLAGVSVVVTDCGVLGTLTMSGGPGSFFQMKEGALAGGEVPITGIVPTVIDMVGPGRLVQMAGYGLGTVQNLVDTSLFMFIGVGHIILESTCTGGIVFISGSSRLTNNAGPGVTIIDNRTPTVTEETIVAGQIGDDTQLSRKIAQNQFTMDDGDTDNLVLLDDDDLTPILRGNATDKRGDPVVLPPRFPARRSRLVPP